MPQSIKSFSVAVLAGIAIALLKSWAIMILLGVLASQTGWPIAIGFVPSVVVWALGSLSPRRHPIAEDKPYA